MKNNTTYLPLIGKYLSGNISKKERVALFKWVEADPSNKSFFDEIVNLWSISEQYSEPFETDTTQAWQKIEQKLGKTSDKLTVASISNGRTKATAKSSLTTQKQASTKIVPLYKQLLKIAAVFLIGVSLTYVAYQQFFPENIVVATLEEERKEWTLPDGSKAWLNENSTLTYKRLFEKRLVFLEGEAFFDVEHLDKMPFEIRSGQAKTIVLGTTFNVRAYPKENRIEVTVETGKVALSEESVVSDTKIIQAGQSGFFDKRTKSIEKEKEKIPNAASWQKQELTFGENTTVYNVIESLRRYYNVEIEVKNEAILNCNFTNYGSFKNPQLENMINILEFALNLQIQREGGTFIVEGEGCPKN